MIDLPWPVGRQRNESFPHRKLFKAFNWCSVSLTIAVFTFPSALFTALSKSFLERAAEAAAMFLFDQRA